MSVSTASTDESIGLARLLGVQQDAFRSDMNPSFGQRLDRLQRLERLLDADAEAEFAEIGRAHV